MTKDGSQHYDNSGRIRQQNNFLIIQEAKIEDSGLYTCIVNNSVGEERVETSVTVRGMTSGCLFLYSDVFSMSKLRGKRVNVHQSQQ